MNLSEIKSDLIKEYKYKIEAHTHTSPASECGEATVEEVIDAYAGFGYDGIVITNHFMHGYNYMKDCSKEEGIKKYLNDYYEAVELGKKKNLKVFLGAEIRFKENSNDYLVYGVDEKMLLEIYDFLPEGLENFRKNYSMPESVLLQAHPFRNGMTEMDPDLLDGYETLNMHPGHSGRLAVATLHAKLNNKDLVIAGSDFHFLRGRHLCVSAIRMKKMPKDSFEFAEILKSKDYLLEIGNQALIFP